MERIGDHPPSPWTAPEDSERLRVLHFISDSYSTEYFRLIARYTDHNRFDIHVASLREPGGLQAGLSDIGIPTFAMGAEERAQYPLTTLRLARWLRRNRVDVLHAHLFEASIVGLVAAKLARTRLTIFTGHHSHEVPLYNRRSLFEVDRFAARGLADAIVAPSREMRETFINVYGCPAEDVVVIEHGLDLSRFDPQRANRDSVRNELQLDNKLVFGAISKHHWVKNLDALVHAFAPIATSREDAHLVILGVGDSSLVARSVRDLGLMDRVSVLPRRHDVQHVLAAFDIFVHAALAESFGFAILEAMAMSKPVVTTHVGIARDVIEDGVSGIRAAGMDPRSLTEAMYRAIALRSRWAELGSEARRRALGFTPQRWVRAHEQLYEARLSKSRRR